MMRNLDLIKDYLSYLKIEKGLSENSINSYEFDLRHFSENIKKDFNLLTEKDFLDYISLIKETYSKYSVFRKVSTIKCFYSFLFKDGIISKNPTEKVESLKRDKSLPEFLTIAEVKAVLNAFPSTYEGKRDLMITKLLIATGARISEILNLKVEDIDYDFKFIRVKGKGSKFRIIPIYDGIGNELRNYINNLRKIFVTGKDEFYVFPGMSRNNYWRRLKEFSKKAGIEKNIHPHLFRHTVATKLLENGADIRVVQEILGHSSIITTEIYTHLNKKNIKKIYNNIKIGDD